MPPLEFIKVNDTRQIYQESAVEFDTVANMICVAKIGELLRTSGVVSSEHVSACGMEVLQEEVAVWRDVTVAITNVSRVAEVQ
jgi:hypothetical protein